MQKRDETSNSTEAPPSPSLKKTGWIFLFVKSAVFIFVALHIYALALKIFPVPGTVLMAQRAISGQAIERNWTRIEDISPYLISAVIAAEDSRFCTHEGLDLQAIQDAISDNQTRKKRRGGSTITQQTAKNIFLWNGGGFIRKVPETWMASFADYVWGKKRVIEIYLNVAEWGDGLFGVESAAQRRFDKSAKDLTPYDAALLAAVLPSPNKWRLDPPGDYVKKRARTIQARLYVVRNEGYADCVLGPAEKPLRAKPKSKPVPKTSPDALPPEKQDESRVPDTNAVEESQSLQDEPPTQVAADELEPVGDDEPMKAPESEDDAGIRIEPPRN